MNIADLALNAAVVLMVAGALLSLRPSRLRPQKSGGARLP